MKQHPHRQGKHETKWSLIRARARRFRCALHTCTCSLGRSAFISDTVTKQTDTDAQHAARPAPGAGGDVLRCAPLSTWHWQALMMCLRRAPRTAWHRAASAQRCAVRPCSPSPSLGFPSQGTGRPVGPAVRVPAGRPGGTLRPRRQLVATGSSAAAAGSDAADAAPRLEECIAAAAAEAAAAALSHSRGWQQPETA